MGLYRRMTLRNAQKGLYKQGPPRSGEKQPENKGETAETGQKPAARRGNGGFSLPAGRPGGRPRARGPGAGGEMGGQAAVALLIFYSVCVLFFFS